MSQLKYKVGQFSDQGSSWTRSFHSAAEASAAEKVPAFIEWLGAWQDVERRKKTGSWMDRYFPTIASEQLFIRQEDIGTFHMATLPDGIERRNQIIGSWLDRHNPPEPVLGGMISVRKRDLQASTFPRKHERRKNVEVVYKDRRVKLFPRRQTPTQFMHGGKRVWKNADRRYFNRRSDVKVYTSDKHES